MGAVMLQVAPSSDTAARRRIGVSSLAAIASWLAVAFALYAPSAARPFDIVDFPQFLPLLRASDSAWMQYRAIVDLYVSEGRMSLLAYAFLVLKWHLFGEWVVGWQLVRFAQMVAAASLLYVLLRAWGVSRLGAYCASTLILCSQVTSLAWIRLNMSEPLGLVLLLLALLLATRVPSWARGRRSLVLLASLAAAMLLMKEMLFATFPAILWAYAAFDGQGAPRPLRLDRRFWTAAAVLASVCILILMPVAFVALTAPARAYARQFSPAALSPTNIAFPLLAILAPFPPVLTDASPIVFAGFVTYALILVVGARAYVTTEDDRRMARDRIWLAVLFPLCCGLAYAPWPNFSLLYAIPYLLSPTLLLGVGITGLERLLGRWTVLGGIAFLLVLTPMAASALAYSRRTDAYLRLSLGVVEMARALPRDKPVMVAACDLPTDSWREIGFVLHRFGTSMQMDLPHFVDADCEVATHLLRSGARDSSVIVVTPITPPLPPGARVVRKTAWSISFPQLRARQEEVAAVVLAASD